MTASEVLTAVGTLPIQDSLTLRASLHPNKKLFTFLDDEFYKFKDSYVPQFLKIHESIKILKFFLKNGKS